MATKNNITENILETDYPNIELNKQPVGEVKKYYLSGEFEKRSDEILGRKLPSEKKVKVKTKTLI